MMNRTDLLHSTDELRKLIIENEGLPLLVFAGEDATSCADIFYWTCCSSCSAYIGEFLEVEQEINEEKVYCDREDFEEDLISWLEFEYEDCSEEEFDELVNIELSKYDPYWRKCIILHVDN